jgi:hypothetical protein
MGLANCTPWDAATGASMEGCGEARLLQDHANSETPAKANTDTSTARVALRECDL